MQGLVLAIQFLSRIPININVDTERYSFSNCVAWFPAAGLLIGTFSGLVYWLSSMLLGGMFPIVCAVLANVCITGGLHVDGLADSCDGLFSARKKERILEIMKDSRIGSNGAIAILFDMLLRLAVLANASASSIMPLMVAAPIAAKSMLPLLMKCSVYARTEGGMGSLFFGRLSGYRVFAAFASGALAVWLLLGLAGIAAFAAALLAVLILRSYIYTKIQGMTGDTLGASNEVAELVFLMAAVIMWNSF